MSRVSNDDGGAADLINHSPMPATFLQAVVVLTVPDLQELTNIGDWTGLVKSRRLGQRLYQSPGSDIP